MATWKKLPKSGEIVDADVAAAAAIAWAKLSKTGSNLTDLATRQHAGLTGVTADLHHAQNHATDHRADGADAIEDALDLLAIPNLSASKITSDTLALARIPTMDTAHIPNLSANKITSDVLALARIPTPLTGKVITDITSGTHDNRPAAGNVGKIYFETDTAKLFVDDGTEWQDCKPPELVENDEGRTTSSLSYVKLKETQLIAPAGSLVITFYLVSGYSGNTSFAQVYRNGTPVGIERSTNSTSAIPYAEVVTGWSEGDLVQVYGRSNQTLKSTTIGEFRFTAVRPFAPTTGTPTAGY